MATYRSPGKRSSSSRQRYSQSANTANKINEKKFSKIIKKITPIIKALKSDSKLIIVGGSVRETLLKRSIKVDIDLATCLKPNEVKRRLHRNNIRTYETGLQHGTITAVINKKNIEITTFRKAGSTNVTSYSESVTDDLKARDFTINAVAYDIFSNKVLDPLNGRKDIKENLLRACGDAAKRFKEDPLRILRMIRFGPAAGRIIEKKTLNAALKLKTLLKKISIERIRLELEKILLSSHPADGIRALSEYNLLEFVVPELIPAVGFEQNKFHTQDVFEHTLSVVSGTPDNLRLRLAALFHDIGKPASLSIGDDGERHFYLHEVIGTDITKKVMRRLKFSNHEIKAVSELVRLHMRPLDCGPAGVRRLMRDLGDYFEDWKKLKIADNPPTISKVEFKKQLRKFLKMVKDELKRLSKTNHNKLAINGHDLIALGEKPGKKLGNILKILENFVIEKPEMNEHSILMDKAKELINEDL